MSEPTSPAGARPVDVLRGSPWREKFLEHTRSHRDLDSARELLEQEWRYVGPLLGSRAGSPAVLDLACGSGPHALAWAARGARVTGLDFDPDLLRVARARAAEDPAGPAPTWTCGDATRLPLRPASFDAVFCNSLLEHVPNWQAVLSEMSRVLRPGGVVIVYTTNRWCPLQQEVNDFPFYSWLPGPIQRRVLAWIMKNRRDLVNYTDFPAVNWFTFPGMRGAFERAGLEPFDRLDLTARHAAPGRRRTIARILSGVPGLKAPYYFSAIAMGLYGVKRGPERGRADRSGVA